MSTTDPDAHTTVTVHTFGFLGTVRLPTGWRTSMSEGADAVALPIDLEHFAGQAFTPNLVVRVTTGDSPVDPANIGRVLSTVVDPNGSSVRSTSVLVPAMPGPLLLQQLTVVAQDSVQLTVAATATPAQWAEVAGQFVDIDASAVLATNEGALHA